MHVEKIEALFNKSQNAYRNKREGLERRTEKKLTDNLNDFLWEVIKNQPSNWRGPLIAIFEDLILKEVIDNKPVWYRDCCI